MMSRKSEEAIQAIKWLEVPKKCEGANYFLIDLFSFKEELRT